MKHNKSHHKKICLRVLNEGMPIPVCSAMETSMNIIIIILPASSLERGNVIGADHFAQLNLCC